MPGFFLTRPSRRDVPRVPVGSHPWALPRGLERPRYAYLHTYLRFFLLSSQCLFLVQSCKFFIDLLQTLKPSFMQQLF
jgi:hypothetical protein